VKRLPLDSPNWVPLAEAHAELSKRRGSGDIAAKVLTKHMAEEHIRSMRWRVGKWPPGPEQELLAGAFWRDEYELYSSNRLLVVPRVRSGQIVGERGFVFYVWGPDLKKFLHTDAALPQPQSAATKVPGNRGRKRVHDRAELQSVALWLAVQRKHGAPEKSRTIVVDELRAWCERHNRKVPADSTLYEIVEAAFQTKPLLKS
jgi:hypothetical protein